MRAAAVLAFASLLVAASACDSKDWHCFSFTYQETPRVACEKGKSVCLARQQEIADIAGRFGDCEPVRRVHCFDTASEDNPDGPRVCTPSPELCEENREHHARGLMLPVDDYSSCYLLEE